MTDSKWIAGPAGNYLLRGDDFHISFNPNTSVYGAAWAGDEEAETALCKNGTFFILNGDYRASYERLLSEGFDACKRFYDQQAHARSSWSQDGDFFR